MYIRSFFFRPVKARPFRFAATLLGIAIGVASVVATVLASRAAVESMKNGVEAIAGRAKLEITNPGGIDESLLPSMRPLMRDADVVPIIEELILLPNLNDTVRVLGLDFLADRSFRDLELREQPDADLSSAVRLLRGEGIAVPALLAERLNAQAGDSVTLNVRSTPVEFEVITIFEPKRFASAWDRVVIMDIALAQKVFGKVGRVDRVEFIPRKGVSLDDLQNAISRVVPENYHIGSASERREQTDRMVRALRFNLTALSGISLIVGAVLVAITLYTSVVQRRYIIALLRSLGATRLQVSCAVLTEAGTMGALGGVLGVALGYFGAQAALTSVRSTIAVVIQDAPESQIQLEPLLAAVGIAMGFFVCLLASVGAVIEALNVPPLQGLKSEKPLLHQRKVYWKPVGVAALFLFLAYLLTLLPAIHDLPYSALASILCVLIAFVVLSMPMLHGLTWFDPLFRRSPGLSLLHLAQSGLLAGSQRAAWAASAVCLSVALAVAMSIMIASFRQTVIDWTNQAMLSDLWIRPLAGETGVPIGRLDPALVDTLVERYGAEQVDPFHQEESFIDGEQITLGAGAFCGARSKYGGVPFRSGEASKEVFQRACSNREVLINEPLARRFGVAEGDTITLNVHGNLVPRVIAGVFYDYSKHQGMVIMDRGDFLQHYPDDGPQGIAVFLPDKMDTSAERERLREVLGTERQIEIMVNRELRQEILNVFDRTFAITRALQLISSIVAGIAVMTVLFALVSERIKDLSLIRALGGTAMQVKQVVLAKAGILGLLGVVSGIAAGFITGIILVKVVNLQSFNWTLRVVYPIQLLVGLSLFVVIACVVAGLAPAYRASRMNLQEALREIE